jgi:hypothetical protein
VAVLPGGSGLVTLHDNGGAVRVRDTATRGCLRIITGASGWIFVLHPSGEVTISTDGGRGSAPLATSRSPTLTELFLGAAQGPDVRAADQP